MFVGGVPIAALAAKRFVPPVVGSPWTPDLLGSKLIAWWDPAFGVSLGSGSDVASWTDRIGGVVAAQATVANRPTFSATARNGTAGILFNGSSQVLSFTPTGFPSNTAASTVAISAYPNNNYGVAFTWGSNVNGNSSLRQYSSTSGKIQYYNNVASFSAAETWFSTDRFARFYQASGTNPSLTINVDGGSDENFTLSTASTTLTSGYIGAFINGSSALFAGAIQAVFVLSQAMMASEAQKLDGWESWHNGKSGSNLPAGHPYKTRAPLTSDP